MCNQTMRRLLHLSLLNVCFSIRFDGCNMSYSMRFTLVIITWVTGAETLYASHCQFNAQVRGGRAHGMYLFFCRCVQMCIYLSAMYSCGVHSNTFVPVCVHNVLVMRAITYHCVVNCVSCMSLFLCVAVLSVVWVLYCRAPTCCACYCPNACMLRCAHAVVLLRDRWRGRDGGVSCHRRPSTRLPTATPTV